MYINLRGRGLTVREGGYSHVTGDLFPRSSLTTCKLYSRCGSVWTELGFDPVTAGGRDSYDCFEDGENLGMMWMGVNLLRGHAMDSELEKHLVAIQNQNTTIKALLLALAEKTGFSEDDLLSDIEKYKGVSVTMDPSPGEVDPEQ